MTHPQVPSGPDASDQVQRDGAIDTSGLKGPYPNPPTRDEIHRFAEHVRKTGQPETYPTIERSSPPPGAKPRIMFRFGVDRVKRPELDEAPCAICSPFAPKCLHRMYLVWYEDEGVIRAIGPECGEHIENGYMYVEAREDYEHRTELERVEEFIHRNLAKVPGMLVALRDLRPAVVEAQRLHRKLRNENDEIARRLRHIANAGGGLLSVSVEIRHEVDEHAGGRKSYERVGPAGFGRGIDTTTQTFGTVVGEKMFRSKFTPVADLDALIERAANLPQVDSADDAFYNWMCSGVSFKEMSDVVDEIRALDDVFRKLLNSLRSVTYFFTPEFFQRLNAWGQHPSNSFDVSAIARGNDYILEYDRSVSRFTPDMDLLALNPEWPDLEEVVTQH